MLPVAYFERYRQNILRLPVKTADEKYTEAELKCSRFRLFTDGDLEVYYAPFHRMNPKAHVILMGLTPGWTQMEEAFRAARKGLRRGLDGKRLFEQIARSGSFAGSMRNNLVGMLDGVSLNKRLGLGSCVELFTTSMHLAHFTSAVSAPVFRNGGNYRGPLLQMPRLRKWLIEELAVELASVPKALIISLGKVATQSVQFLHEQKAIDLDRRCLISLPHPSGANGHRKGLFADGRVRWSRQIANWFEARA
jgi:hypothetical protein